MFEAVCRRTEIITDVINKIAKLVLALLVFIPLIVMFVQVFFRYVLDGALLWPEEMVRFMLIWITFLGSGIAIRGWDHIYIEILATRLSGRKQIILMLFVRILVFIGAILLIWHGGSLALDYASFNARTMEISMLWPRLALPVGGFVMVSNILYLIMKDIDNLLKTIVPNR